MIGEILDWMRYWDPFPVAGMVLLFVGGVWVVDKWKAKRKKRADNK